MSDIREELMVEMDSLLSRGGRDSIVLADLLHRADAEIRELRTQQGGEAVGYILHDETGCAYAILNDKAQSAPSSALLYTHPPAPVVPEEMPVDDTGLCAPAYAFGWNACRKAMLKTARAQEGFVTVPVELTAEILTAMADCELAANRDYGEPADFAALWSAAVKAAQGGE